MKIIPVTIGFPLMEATELKVTIGSFPTDAITCMVNYMIYSVENIIISSGSIQLTEEEFTAWGQDNTYIENIVLERLGLERLIEE